MKTRDFKKNAAGLPLPTAPPAPGELTKVPPAELAGTEPAGLATAETGESPDSSESKAKQRWLAGLFAALAAVFLTLGAESYAMFLAACALLAALDGETRWRVPTLVKVCAVILMAALGIITIVLMILEARGR
jgi:hypothetical protein